jgi:hypothetical protein
MCRARHAPLVIFIAAAATVVLEAVPIEAWILPVCILAGDSRRKEPLAAAVGIFAAMSSLYALGRIGGGEAVGFILETSGLRSLYDFQDAREVFGGWMPLFAGWKGPSARDIAVMAGQRGFPSPYAYFPLVAVNALARAFILSFVANRARRSHRLVGISADFAVMWWILLAGASFFWSRW